MTEKYYEIYSIYSGKRVTEKYNVSSGFSLKRNASLYQSHMLLVAQPFGSPDFSLKGYHKQKRMELLQNHLLKILALNYR